jgi:hypothetical protein
LPAAQFCEQQLAKPTHDWPLAEHDPPSLAGIPESWPGMPASRGGGGAPHEPLVHLLLQQSLAAMQLVPSARQADDWHVPPTQSWLQQSDALEHAAA